MCSLPEVLGPARRGASTRGGGTWKLNPAEPIVSRWLNRRASRKSTAVREGVKGVDPRHTSRYGETATIGFGQHCCFSEASSDDEAFGLTEALSSFAYDFAVGRAKLTKPVGYPRCTIRTLRLSPGMDDD